MRKPTGKVFMFCGLTVVIVPLMLLLDGRGVFSHSGRTDSSGGHYNRKTGTYHYHGAPKSSTSTYSSTTSNSNVQNTEIATLTSEIRKLRSSVDTLNSSVQTLIARLEVSPDQTSNKATDRTLVYVTQAGAKYHRDGCRYLTWSKIPISLIDAKEQYSPCSVCKPEKE